MSAIPRSGALQRQLQNVEDPQNHKPMQPSSKLPCTQPQGRGRDGSSPEARIDELKALLMKRDAEIQRLRIKLTSVTSPISTGARHEVQSVIEPYKALMALMASEYGRLASSTVSRDVFEALKAEKVSLEFRNYHLLGQLAHLQDRVEALDDYRNRHEDSESGSRVEMSHSLDIAVMGHLLSVNEDQCLQQELQKSNAENQALVDELNRANAFHDTLTAEVEAVIAARASAEARLKQVTQELSDLRRQVSGVKDDGPSAGTHTEPSDENSENEYDVACDPDPERHDNALPHRIAYLERIRGELAATKHKLSLLTIEHDDLLRTNEELVLELHMYKSVPLTEKPQTVLTRIARNL